MKIAKSILNIFLLFCTEMEKMESALDVLSRAATMVQPCPPYPASDSDGFGK